MRLGGRAYPVALVAGALLSLAFPEPSIAPLAWLGLVPLLWLCRGADAWRGFRLGLVFGIGFFGALLIWISIVGYVAWAMLLLLEAFFIAVLGATWALASRFDAAAVRVVLAASAWVALEFLRSVAPLGGFTWGQLAQSQHDLHFWTLRPAAWGGAWLVAGLLAALNALFAEAIEERGLRRAVPGVAAAALLAAPFALPWSTADGPTLRVAIVQGNVPRDFLGTQYDKELAITRSHARLTRAIGPDEVDLVVWPESSVGLDIERDVTVAAEVSDAARSIDTPMIVGGNLDIDTERYKVMAFLVARDGTIVDSYQKTHLVPFGEYVPGRDLLSWVPMLDQVPRDAVAGAEHRVFPGPKGSIATVISFEGDFGSLVRKPIAAGGRLLVVATNTSTWGNSWASAQHVAFSQVRAAETGVGVVHAALSGISAFIEPGGEIVASTELYEPTTLTRLMSFGSSSTFYVRTGDWFAYLSLMVTVIGVALALKPKR